MAKVEQVIPASPEQVWAALADGWTYSDWVVGTVHIRDVDENWPAPGSRLYHKAGPWPFSLHDGSRVLECEPGRRLKLRVGIWPVGEASVTMTLVPQGETATRITFEEEPVAGPFKWAHNRLNDLVLHQRNRESLRRLSDVAARQKAIHQKTHQ
ncbi:SRPBCC family protein [Catenuloplanes atrovinosus]|uniref:Uncharacterized protein YndB with AHSA1/START domain n=1 Tax=Catenuloplanes atrovinosus TaxID=137266 RepID=A0AAE3YK77_9ACTN|nr:SRPBCC family protein [Catenuloplanes atrovinosus]MDR7274037.1 uncharacterized protein YndB with AHSA1/START domain [Catenuloplanes atrovinosus]